MSCSSLTVTLGIIILLAFCNTCLAASAECLYVASLKASTSGGNVALEGGVVALNATGGQQANFSSTPLAVAVDPVSSTLFVSTPANIQQFDIGDNLSSGRRSCPCTFSTLNVSDYTIQTMAVDTVQGNLFFALANAICVRPVSGSDLDCRSYTLPAGDSLQLLYIPPQAARLYAMSNLHPHIYVISLTPGSSYMDVVTTWIIFPDSSASFSGISTGPSGNLYMLATHIYATQPCAVVEVDIVSGLVLSCFTPPIETQDLFNSSYGLLYSARTSLFYTFVQSNVSQDNFTIISSGFFDVQLFDLVPSSTPGQLQNTLLEYLARDIESPVDGTLGECPQAASATPIPSSSSGAGIEAIVVPAVLGSLLLLLVLALICCGLAWFHRKKRRKYFEADDRSRDTESGTELESKFTFREIDGKDLRLGKLMAEGAFGKVYKGEYRGAMVAVKMFEALRLDQADDKIISELRMEAQMMERLSNHPSIVKFVGAITQGDEGAKFALVTEWCPRGSLYDLLVKKKKKLPLITLVRMARDIAAGILHLHKEHIVHRDIASRNVLVGQNYEVYVADFGLARVQAAEVGTTKQDFGPIAWMAPEALKSREYSTATDAFSFGVLLWEMMVKKRPWAGEEPAQIIQAVTSNTRLKIPKDCDPIFARVMKMCWRHTPAQRPTFDKLADILANYYKQLHAINANAFESSEPESDPESEEEGSPSDEGLSYEEWQRRRVKEEVKSFMKQLIIERNDDFDLVADANMDAFAELRAAFKGHSSGDDSDETESEGGDAARAEDEAEREDSAPSTESIVTYASHVAVAHNAQSRPVVQQATDDEQHGYVRTEHFLSDACPADRPADKPNRKTLKPPVYVDVL